MFTSQKMLFTTEKRLINDWLFWLNVKPHCESIYHIFITYWEQINLKTKNLVATDKNIVPTPRIFNILSPLPRKLRSSIMGRQEVSRQYASGTSCICLFKMIEQASAIWGYLDFRSNLWRESANKILEAKLLYGLNCLYVLVFSV